nr:zinc finger, CCHC-type [Tanacetum cinerariifolium]
MEILLDPTSNKLSKDSILQAENPINEILIKFNLPDHRSREYTKTFIGSGAGTVSVQVLERVEFEVEPREDHTFKVEPLRNAGQGAGSQKVGFKKDMDARSHVYVRSNGFKESNDENNDYYYEYAPAKRNVLGTEITRDQSGYTLRVSQPRVHNEKLVETLLDGHSILSLESSLSRDCDVEKKCNTPKISTTQQNTTWGATS